MSKRRIAGPISVVLLLSLALAACGSSSLTPETSATASLLVAASGATTPGPNASGPNASPINDMTCDVITTSPGLSARISLTLDDGSAKPVLPTPGIGALTNCRYWVYSDANGDLVVAAPLKAQVTLGDFISLWALTNPSDPLFIEFATAMSGPTRSITVNGKPVAGDKWQNMALADGMKIVASSAAPPIARPTPSAPAGSSAKPVPSPSARPVPSPSAS